MIYLPATLSFCAAGLLLALGLIHLGRGDRRAQKTYFILTCFILCASQSSLGAMLLSTAPERALLSFRFLLGFSVFVPAVMVPFLSLFGRREEKGILSGPGIWIAAVSILIGSAVLLLPPRSIIREVHFSESIFWGLTFTSYGKLAAAYLLLANVLGLFFLENTYRSASVAGKVTLKYPLLGILTITVLTFIIISRILAVSLTDRSYLAIHSCGFIALSISFFYATIRYHLFDIQAYIGRDFVTSVLTVTISGIYITALALISFLARLLGFPYDRFASTVIGMFAVFLLIAVLISGRAKRRLRHFIETNFYANRYDYRKEWKRYAQLMGSSETIDEFLSNFISLLCETMLVKRGIVWANIKGGKIASYGFDREKPDIAFIKLVASVAPRDSVAVFKSGLALQTPSKGKASVEGGGSEAGWIRASAPIASGHELFGIILLGEKSMNIAYGEEDRECLSTLSDQAALTLENLLSKEQILDSKQMESFNRLSSFVIHDLKNAIGMLSLTAENAKENISDPEFQRDAFATIERSINKMKGLIHSLNALKAPTGISRKSENITKLVERALADLKPVADSHGIQIELAATDNITGEVDASALERVVENLLMNALDATGQGGKVSASVNGVDEGWIEIAIKDTGSGFDPVFLEEHLYRPFRSTKKGGLGIGLLMCRTLVRAHGGDLAIESEKGHGATVTIRMPALSFGAE
ncbi:MAG: PEP-CTERM system histidine kinase PrsK [Candidatus Latescibacteria bacterium]|nr:PEP-CTERM system histidine kinase PrsK [Candidatus Latescibacterota bacterium]NIO00948.1 PEP-CTERM system histidine kinase PrsK [Candidatus Latescibacterota bacterium]NIO27347.1 PEP-CTERM system histidine kinase PrsK [Candidatus Latescibacterota bacterium]NIO54869.1 PEP-CTERM system histidine kinase PrsK [Candidatus Latescibacterota bacterium]NIT00958.1 PEP-CTERM system histidine kinase PrsK [Candidatus Latescibacterota bacterium]